MPPTDPDDIDWSFSDSEGKPITDPIVLLEIYRDIIRFGMVFANYVKETDPALWNRASDFAKDYTKGSVVKFLSVDMTEDKHGENTHGTE